LVCVASWSPGSCAAAALPAAVQTAAMAAALERPRVLRRRERGKGAPVDGLALARRLKFQLLSISSKLKNRGPSSRLFE
jgi:hypothetical protein